MRFVPLGCLREGMTVGKTIYGKNSERMLVVGTVLDNHIIYGLSRLKYSGIYIEDDISRDIEIVNVISEDLRLEATKGMKRIFIIAENSNFSAVRTSDISKQIESIIDELLSNKNLMVNMIDLKCFDNYTYAHSVNVAVLSIIIGITMGMRKNALSRLGLGAIMHDIGKVFINKGIINKPGKLTDDEFDQIKTHPLVGYEYVKNKLQLPTSCHMAIIDHHEKYDGTGYPNSKAGNEISVFGRIISVADVYDALTSERPYRGAIAPSESMEYIMGNTGSAFDPDIVKIFCRKIAPYPVGTTVTLSNGYLGLVMENYEACCLRPKIRVINDGSEDITPFEIDLKDDYNYLNVTIGNIVNEPEDNPVSNSA